MLQRIKHRRSQAIGRRIEQSETLFILTRNFLKNVDFTNYDTAVNGTITSPVVFDDSEARIEFNYGGKSLTARISSISNPTIGTKELDTLLHFVNKFKPVGKE